MSPAPASAPVPLVRDFGRPSASIAADVRWDVRTAYDFLFSLSDDCGSTDDLPSEDRRWLENAKGALRSQVGNALDMYAHEILIALATLAIDRPDVRDAAAFLRLLHTTPTDELVLGLFGDDLRDPTWRERTERALSGDPAGIEAFLTEMGKSMYHAQHADLFRRLFADPRSVLDPAIDVLVRWLPWFTEVEPRVGVMLQRDFDLRAEDRATLAPGALIEKTTGGIRWISEPGVRRVILAPSYFTRPYNYVLGGPDWRLYGYPIADAALDGTDPLAPPQSLVRLHRALGDDTRLRILRLLRDQDFYLTEIAERLELSKPTIKHHLALLRSAGFVTIVEEGGMQYYSLKRERLDDASGELKHFLVD
jgi:DNA-binding transcriptional ArsR family regulator